MGRKYSERTHKVLAMRSGGICAHPDCNQQLILDATHPDDPDAVVGEIAHIFAYSDQGPRPNPTNIKAQRNHYSNLIYLCNVHHTLVDNQENQYSVSVLLKWKTDHEAWVRNAVGSKIPEITSAEMDIVAKALIAKPMKPTTDFHTIPIAEKMHKNNITSRMELLMRQGLAGSHDVEDHITHMSFLIPDFAESLKAGFVQKYNQLYTDGLRGDDLFEGIMLATTDGHFNIIRQATSLTMLVYLFHKCEIFEK